MPLDILFCHSSFLRCSLLCRDRPAFTQLPCVDRTLPTFMITIMALPISHSCYLVLCLFSFANLAFSQSTITTTATVSSVTPGTQTASSTYNVFSAIASSSSHNGATGSTDDPDTSAAANAEGAAGSQAGAFNLSNGAIIAISVVAGAAVILGSK